MGWKVPKRVLTDLINEMNNMALSLEEPGPLISWAVSVVNNLLDCQFTAISLIRHDTVLCAYGTCCETESANLDFEERVLGELKKTMDTEHLCFQEMDKVAIDIEHDHECGDCAVKSLYVSPIVARGDNLGYLFLGSSSDAKFVKYRLNMVDSFSMQLGLGLSSLLDKSVIAEQAKMLENEKQRVEREKKTVDAIVGGMREGLILTDKDGSIITYNVTAGEMMGLAADEQKKQLEDIMTGSTSNESGSDLVVNKGDEKKVIHVSSTIIQGVDEQLLGRTTLLTDVTKEKEIDQMKTEFVSSVSHELRTPLTSIREAIALVSEGITGEINKKQGRCLEVALQDTDRLSRIINDLLNLSRIESGKIELKCIDIPARDIIDYAVTAISPQLEANGIEHDIVVDDKMPNLCADRDQLIQVLTNFIGNAIKFTPSGGKITVSASIKDDSFIFRVKDTGPGISQEDQEKLFKKFSQLDNGMHRKTGGTGLGLGTFHPIHSINW